uniref:Uncharacterized protein n=1 Tax=Arion vulgaris TaxID=1028688 RepID=A0A0B6Z877_9EUPU
MLIAIAEQVESEKNVSNKNYASTQHQDVLHSRQSGQRKCQHAKRMTEDERKYYKNTSTCKAKEKRKQKCPPALGVRRSSRAKKSVLYFY